MTKKKNDFARDDLLTDCTKYYDSKTRKGKYVNICDLCHETMENKVECKRATWGINQWGNTNYTIVHVECFIKSLKTEITKAKLHEKERRKDFDIALKIVMEMKK